MDIVDSGSTGEHMAEILGVFGPATFVILVVAVVGLVPVVLYRDSTANWFLYAYGFLFVAAFATNFENLLLPDLLNYTEHFVGNLGAGLAFAVAAYVYRKENIEGDDEAPAGPEGG
jgi:hypothetical protein